MNKIKKYFMVFIAALIAVIFLNQYITILKERNALRTNVTALYGKINSYKAVINGKEIEIAKKQNLILSLRDAVKTGEVRRDELRLTNKRLLSEVSRLNAKLEVAKTIRDTVNIHDTIMGRTELVLPAHFEWKDKYLNLKVSVMPETWNFHLVNDVPINVLIGDKTVVYSDNPYIHFTDIKTTTIQKRTKFWNRPAIKFAAMGAAFFGGFYLGSLK